MVKGFGCRQACESLSCRNPRSAFSELRGLNSPWRWRKQPIGRTSFSGDHRKPLLGPRRKFIARADHSDTVSQLAEISPHRIRRNDNNLNTASA